MNIAGYRFVDLPDRDKLRTPFKQLCDRLNLKGTILLSHEGINFFLAGKEASINEFLVELAKDERFEGIPLKVSHADHQPFRRMLVKLKREIISIGIDDVRPAEKTGSFVSPQEFKQWMDDGEDLLVLDTRNDYEVRLGTFSGAVDLGIQNFRQFPEAVEGMNDDLKSKRVVMFCTGGIRCEKASVVMMNAGFEDVYQIDGGVLGYFEKCGGVHWDGECFVFDRRVAVAPDLQETNTVVCFACREPLTIEEQSDNSYVPGVSCTYCA